MTRDQQPAPTGPAPAPDRSPPGIHIECPRCRSFTYVPEMRVEAATFDCDYCHHTCNTDTAQAVHA